MRDEKVSKEREGGDIRMEGKSRKGQRSGKKVAG